jgi:hypothetical protein
LSSIINGVGFDLWRLNQDGVTYSKMKFLGSAWLFVCFFSCVVAVAWVMEQEELKTEIRGKSSKS